MSEVKDWCEKPHVTETMGNGWCVRINGTDVFDSINQYGCKTLRSMDIAKGLGSKEEAEAYLTQWLSEQIPDFDAQRLRADTAEAEVTRLEDEFDTLENTNTTIKLELAAAEQRIADVIKAFSKFRDVVRDCERLASSYSPCLDSVDENGGDDHEDPTCAIFHRLYYAMFDADAALSTASPATINHQPTGRGVCARIRAVPQALHEMRTGVQAMTNNPTIDGVSQCAREAGCACNEWNKPHCFHWKKAEPAVPEVERQLLPCPLCGKEPRYVPADYVDEHGQPWPFAECNPCNVGAPVEFWNKRIGFDYSAHALQYTIAQLQARIVELESEEPEWSAMQQRLGDENARLRDRIAELESWRGEPTGYVSSIGNGFVRVRTLECLAIEQPLYTAPPAPVAQKLGEPTAYLRNEGTPNNLVVCPFDHPDAFKVFRVPPAPVAVVLADICGRLDANAALNGERK